MSILEKLHAFIDPKLKATYETKAYDPAKDRAWVVSRLEATKTQFSSTESGRGGGRKLWSVANGVVAFSPIRPDKQPLVINGQTTNFIPSERFVEFVDTMIAAVNAGEFDAELKANTTAGTTVAVKPRAPRAAGSGDGKGWSEERRQRFAATVAARKAAKEGAQ